MNGKELALLVKKLENTVEPLTDSELIELYKFIKIQYEFNRGMDFSPLAVYYGMMNERLTGYLIARDLKY